MPCKIAIPTLSLGQLSAGHSLESRLDAAQKHGYQGIEICFPDLVAASGGDFSVAEHCPSPEQRKAAIKIHNMCKARGLTIICLQPFMNYEGLRDRNKHDGRYIELRVWIELARVLGTDMIMMPASSLPPEEVTDDMELIVKDLQKAADAGREHHPHVRFAYEPRCNATRIDRWEFAWDKVQKVNRSNFGLCLDTFHLAGLVFADPAAPSGRVPDGQKAVELSMRRLVKRLKMHSDKVFLVQMGDASLPSEPIVPGSPEHDPKARPRTTWSQKYRLFYGEVARGAYLPIKDISDAIFNGIGYEGWVSLELFNTRTSCGAPNLPTDLACRGAISWGKLANDMAWWPSPVPKR